MPPGTLDDRYLEWLYSQVAVVKHRRSSKTYWGLLGQLYSIEFAWTLPNDEDRATDGIALRSTWSAQTGTEIDSNWASLPCSFLEMLIALSGRAAFQSGLSVDYWFWELIKNLGFERFTDAVGNPSIHKFVEDKVRTVNYRIYDEANTGGLFPMHTPRQDQRTVDIWYQLCFYLLQD